MKLSDNDASLRAANNYTLRMKTVRLFLALAALTGTYLLPEASFADNEGVALAIIYDTSGSMRELVPDTAGHSSPKYVIANRALIDIAKQIDAFTTRGTNGPRKVEAGLFVFDGKSGAREAIPFGPFNAADFENWANHFSNPSGNTPLGNALTAAGEAVLKSSLPRKHILIITDGINTAGPQPAAVMPRLKQRAAEKQTSLALHFVAFDVDAKVFDPVKKHGASVVGASNEAQLNTQLQYILQHQILLEEEEPPKKKE